MSDGIKKRPASYTHSYQGGHCYYFELGDKTPPPYRKQIHVDAILDIASDGTLAGVEIIDMKAPPPPTPKS